jgi:hypothetical protein
MSDNGVKSSKMITLESLSMAIRSSDETFELPLLPNGIRKWKQTGNNVVVAIEYPEQIIERFCYNDKNYTIPVPRSIWIVLLSPNNRGVFRYKIHKTHVYSLVTPLLSESQTLYEWPFTNHSITYTPGVCWGSSPAFGDLKDDCTIRNLSSLYSIYFNAIFNDHLGWKMKTGDAQLRDYAVYLNNKPSFLSSDLLTSGVTFAQAINNILGLRI